ncbi:hypothetical protein BMS3Bbin04_00813 [bacterium BMS3Bbin04]|nr:hypothetical protein BMS3Bbin04_00813 [bacterium BMS3Bbin04]
MKIGLLVDGEAEFRALPKLIERIIIPNQVVKTLRADLQPLSPDVRIIKEVEKKIPIFTGKNVDIVIVLLDRENRTESPSKWVEEINKVAVKSRRCSGVQTVFVIKDRTFENWLLSDISTVASIKGRYTVSKALRSKIEPNKADGNLVIDLMKKAAKKEGYSKVRDAVFILSKANADKIAANSRSFRRFMRVLGYQPYANQSCLPV